MQHASEYVHNIHLFTISYNVILLTQTEGLNLCITKFGFLGCSFVDNHT